MQVSILVWGYKYTTKAGRDVYSKVPNTVTLYAKDKGEAVKRLWGMIDRNSKIKVL